MNQTYAEAAGDLPHLPTRTSPRLAALIEQTWRRWEQPMQTGFLALIRAVYGWLFVQTGLGKLTHFERTTAFFESLGLPLPAANAGFVGASELVGGLLLLLGLWTRPASLTLAFLLVVALLTAHRAEAFTSLDAFTEQAPYPFLVATLVLLSFGAGRLSLDAVLRRRENGVARSSGG